MTETLPQPASREEEYLATIAGMTGIELPTPASRKEEYLNAIAQNGGGGGGATYTAGDNIQISSDNVISATDTTYNNFTGTDGTAAGTSGLVPAPATTDAGKFLKADGTWSLASSGSAAKELTSADYNYPSDNPTKVVLRLLEPLTLSANQGKALKDLVDSLVISGSGAPTTATVGTIGKIYEDSTNGKLYICTGATSPYTWAEVGGSSVVVVQSTGDSSTKVMSQDATTRLVYSSPYDLSAIRIGQSSSAYPSSVAIGSSSSTYGGSVAVGPSASCYTDCVAIGSSSRALQADGVAIGSNAWANASGSIAIGKYSLASTKGEMNIGTQYAVYGYNSSNYRLLTGLYDGQSAHDAATVAQGNTLATSAPTTSTVGVLGQLYTDTTNMLTYQCTAISGDTYTWTQRW